MSNFPEEMLQEIFIRLPVKSLLRFKCVSKALCSLIRSRSFINMHHNLTTNIKNSTSFLFGKSECMYSIDYNSLLTSSTVCEFDECINRIDYPFKPQANYAVDFICSCNGLLCVCCSNKDDGKDHHNDEIYLWNPSTMEYKKIPAEPLKTFHRLDLGVYGFGYDNNVDTYKLIRVIDFNGDWGCSEVDIYTLRSNSWRSIQNIPYYFEHKYRYYQGVLYNGALHWLAVTIGERRTRVLISFDIANESFGEVALPEKVMQCPEKRWEEYDISIAVLEGCVCLLFQVYTVRMDVWIMQDYGVGESWIKSFSITQECLTASNDNYLTSLWSFTNNLVIMKGGKSLLVCDLKNKRYKELVLPDINEFSDIIVGGNYVPSLVLLN